MKRLLRTLLLPVSISLMAGLLGGCGSGGGSEAHSSSESTSSAHVSSATASSGTSSSAAPIPEECLPDSGIGAAGEATGFHVENGVLYDSRGSAFVMRGINYPYAWFHQRDTQQDLADIASTCANSVRIVLSNGEHPGWRRVPGTEVSQLIEWATASKLVVILEVHDATGWPQNESAAHPQTAVDYWLSDDIRTALQGTEGVVLINIANEPLGNFATPAEDRSQWLDFHINAIETLRDANITHTLIVDAPNWGQDWTNSMRDGDAAQQVFAADPMGNIVFSVHMYDVYGTTVQKSGRVKAYMDAFVDKNLPLIIGEFAADHGPGVNNDVDEDAILHYAETYRFGYLGWSWSGNGGNLGSLDIVQGFNVNNLSPWGERLINGINGIRGTSIVCSCFEED